MGSPEHRLSLATTSRLWIEGDSTLHRFKADATELHASFAPERFAGELEDFIRTGGIRGAELTIPVRGLRSGESSLDDNMWRELQASRHPQITFRMESYETPSAAVIRMKGRLSIAGTERSVEVDSQLEVSPGRVRISGSRTVAMTEYGIKPPTLMLGMLKVKDAVVIRFDLTLVSAD